MSDRNKHSFFGEEASGRFVSFDDESGEGYDDLFKFTGKVHNCVVSAGHVTTGREDGVDMNNEAHACVIEAALWDVRGKFLATIKGGSSGCHVGGYVRGHGSSVDVDLGNWSDQNKKRTGANLLALTHEKREPITVRVLHSEEPILATGTGPYKFVFPKPGKWYHPLAVQLFHLLRRLGLFR
jgi:hypothetical protein